MAINTEITQTADGGQNMAQSGGMKRCQWAVIAVLCGLDLFLRIFVCVWTAVGAMCG